MRLILFWAFWQVEDSFQDCQARRPQTLALVRLLLPAGLAAAAVVAAAAAELPFLVSLQVCQIPLWLFLSCSETCTASSTVQEFC